MQGGVPNPVDIVAADKLYGTDQRVGITIDPRTRTAAESAIYGVKFVVLKPVVCLYAEVIVTDNAPADTELLPPVMTLGGEGRAVAVKVVKSANWPDHAPVNGRSLWLLATPAFVVKSYPSGLLRDAIRAAASGSPIAVSGWDRYRRGPDRTRFAVPAGSVYFTEQFDPGRGPYCLVNDEAAAGHGWGFALRGVWK